MSYFSTINRKIMSYFSMNQYSTAGTLYRIASRMSNRAENANSLRYGRVHRLRHLRLRPPLRKHLRGKKKKAGRGSGCFAPDLSHGLSGVEEVTFFLRGKRSFSDPDDIKAVFSVKKDRK